MFDALRVSDKRFKGSIHHLVSCSAKLLKMLEVEKLAFTCINDIYIHSLLMKHGEMHVGIDRCILYTHVGSTGVPTLSSKAGRGEYFVSLLSCLPLPFKYLPQPSSLSLCVETFHTAAAVR